MIVLSELYDSISNIRGSMKVLMLFGLSFIGCNILSNRDDKSSEEQGLKLLWEIPYEFVGIGITATPLILGDSLVIMSAGREIFAVEQSSGNIRWKYFVQNETDIQTDEFLTDGKRIFATHVEDIRAINIKDGSEAWRTNFPEGRGGFWNGTMSYYNGKIFVASHEVVYCIDSENGSIKWQTRVYHRGTLGNVVLNGDIVIVGGGYGFDDSLGIIAGTIGKLYALDGNTGDTLWSYITASDGGANYPTIENGILYVGGYFPYSRGGFEAINIQTRQQLWKSDIGNYCVSTIVVDDKVIALASEYHVVAFDKHTGRLLWERMVLHDAEARKLHYYNGYIYHTQGWKLFVINPDNGDIVYSFKPERKDLVTIAVANDKVFVCGHPTLQCYEVYKPGESIK